MSWSKIKLRQEDILFSKYIRARDKKCVYCGSPHNLQCSHYHGRRKETTRYDVENCDALCAGCHKKLEHEKGWTTGEVNGQKVNLPRLYTQFKIKQLGQARYDALLLRASKPGKKDLEMERIKVKALLNELKAA